LKSLRFTAAAVTDLTPLSNLTRLESLEIESASAVDVRPLAKVKGRSVSVFNLIGKPHKEMLTGYWETLTKEKLSKEPRPDEDAPPYDAEGRMTEEELLKGLEGLDPPEGPEEDLFDRMVEEELLRGLEGLGPPERSDES
jgi:hypothetical protein